MSVPLEREQKLEAHSHGPLRHTGFATAGWDVPRIPDIGKRTLATGLVRAALVANVRLLVQMDVRLRSDSPAETIHDARVAVRRLRSHLRTFRPLLHKAWADSLRERLAWLSDILSCARDADVLVASIEHAGADLPPNDRQHINTLLEPFRKRRSEAHVQLSEALRSQHYIHLLDAAIGAARAPQFRQRAYTCGAEDIIVELMQPVWKRLRSCVKAAGAAPHDRTLHAIRIKAKHVRYAAKALAPVAGSGAKRFARRVEALQTLLGEQHDAIVAYHALGEERGNAERAFLAGEVAARELATANHARQEWTRYWRRIGPARFW